MQTTIKHLPWAKILGTLCTLLILVTTTPTPAYAQRLIHGNQSTATHPGKGVGNNRNKRFDSEKYRQDFANYAGKQAGLTAEEARKFFPVFFEMKNQQRNLMRQRRRALKQAAEQNMSERDCLRVLNQANEMTKKAQRIEADYTQRLRNMVGARKLVKVMTAENKFSKQTFKQMTEKGR